MGINLVWVCDRHRRYHYSIRGEEGIDFQALVTTRLGSDGCPAACMEAGRIVAWPDSHCDRDDYEEWWPVWEMRPAELRKLRTSQIGGKR